VWPKFYPTTANYKELDAAGFMYRKNVEDGFLDWVGKGYTSSFYDPYSKAARDIYWRQMNDKLGVLGIDAWWMDATEPDLHSNLDIDSIKQRIGPTAIGSSTDHFNSYALVHSGGVYEGSRAARPDKRVFILTRSGFGGIQRNAAAVWSGDIASRWDDLYHQISAGVSIGYAGVPNWTFDIGGFANESRYSAQKPAAADQEEWRELNLRWFQFGAFVPLFRSHGEFPLREIYNLAPQGSEVYDSLVWHDRLRYRLMPYIYTVAANTYHHDGTIMRGLSMDFLDDLAARDVRDEYLFGNAFLVAPVYQYQARSRPVYLPAGAAWYDFHGGKRLEGGQKIDAAAPLNRMPLFVRCRLDRAAGSGRPVRLGEARRRHHPVRLHRRERQLRALRGRWRELRLRKRPVLAHPDALRRDRQLAGHRRAHRQLSRHARGAHVQGALDQGRHQPVRSRRKTGCDGVLQGRRSRREVTARRLMW
jgi:alpha-D-xyloside xylohydrolase